MYEQQRTTEVVSPPQSTPPPEQSHRGKRKLWFWLAVAAFAALIIYWIFFGRGQTPAQQPAGAGGRRGFTGPISITTATATKGDIGVYLDAIGTVTALYTDAITAQVTGVITSVHYKEGQFVRKGDPLIDIDPRPYEATVMQAQGALERDRNLLAQAQMDLERYRDAWARNAIQRQTMEDQEKIVLQDQGTVKNDEGALRYDEVQLAYCHITSPIEGRVGLRLVDPGNLVTANGTTTLVVITETQPITVIATIAEDHLSDVMQQPHHGINLKLDAWDRANQKKLSTGKVTSFDNQIDTTTGTVKLRALFDNKHDELYPNEFVNTRLLVKTLHEQTLLPDSTIQHNGSTAFVYVIRNSQASLRKVKTGVSDGGLTSVEGVNPGEVVANSSFEKLQNNSKVVITQAPPPSNSNEANTP